MKYESSLFYNLQGCAIRYTIKALDVLAFRHLPTVLVMRVIGSNHITQQEAGLLWDQISQVIETTDQEIETIESVASAVAKGLTVEVSNSLLARWAFGVCSVYINAVNADGLLQGIDWASLPYWTFLVLVHLQRHTIQEANKRKKTGAL